MLEGSSKQDSSMQQYVAVIQKYIGRICIMNIGRKSTEHQGLCAVVGCAEGSLIIDFRRARRQIESLERLLMVT